MRTQGIQGTARTMGVLRTGSVRFVYRHLAILGPPSVQAAIAAECAHEQGKFWPYHDRLFASAGLFALTTSNLKRYAEELELDRGRFGSCLDAERPREKVERETEVGRAIGMTSVFPPSRGDCRGHGRSVLRRRVA